MLYLTSIVYEEAVSTHNKMEEELRALAEEAMYSTIDGIGDEDGDFHTKDHTIETAIDYTSVLSKRRKKKSNAEQLECGGGVSNNGKMEAEDALSLMDWTSKAL